jgi:hypothetical protein
MNEEKSKHEDALESLAVSVWQIAGGCDNLAEWSRAYDWLFAIETYLNRLQLRQLAGIANDLKSLASIRAGMLKNTSGWMHESLERGMATEHAYRLTAM